MKAHLAKLSLALLSAVFLLGCQEQGSEPVGPEGLGPQFHAAHDGTCTGHDKKENLKCGVEPPPPGDDATFTVTFTGDVIGGANLFGPQGGKKNIQTNVHDPAKLALSKPFQSLITNGIACFGSGTSRASMQIWLKSPTDPLNATVGFWFTAKGNDGTTVINYVLQFDGLISGGPGLPSAAPARSPGAHLPWGTRVDRATRSLVPATTTCPPLLLSWSRVPHESVRGRFLRGPPLFILASGVMPRGPRVGPPAALARIG